MSEYSDALDTYAASIDPTEDDYEEKLKEVANSFRGFNKALSNFIAEHGFSGNINNSSEKINFLKNKFKASRITPPRHIENWFASVDWKSRETAFKICFALNLGVDDTNDFFRRVQFERSFDCHKINEAVYYFCIKNNLKFSDAERIINKIKVNDTINKSQKVPDNEILYTNSIVEEINQINDENKLVLYITENIDNFSYNNATAIKFIKHLWKKISGPNGLAKKEGEYIEKQLNLMTHDTDSIEKKFLADNYIVSSDDASSWTIFVQILGLDKSQEIKFAKKRSLKSAFSKNVLMPLKAASSFPNSQLLNSMLRGEHGDNESYRKMLILLVFYSFWAEETIKNETVFVEANKTDCEKCLIKINDYLMEAGYPTMYFGNPYDWIFMWALRDKNPLFVFRNYILEVLISAEEND